MAQVFSQRAVLLIKLGLTAFPALAVAGVAVYRWNVSLPAARGATVRQPIPFSHKHHVSDDGIDCRYCHTTVERSRFAGMPSTETCMSCHSQLFRDAPLLGPLRDSLLSGKPLAWGRVHDLPDFVYFDHSIHVRNGVACSECHGPVEQMPLMWREASLEMQWCLDCHRRPERHLQSVRRLTDCSTCHR